MKKRNQPNEESSKIESLIIFKCNCNCIMCSTGLQIDRSIYSEDYQAIRPFNDIKKDIDRAVKMNARGFAFSGGEPTLRKDLAELVKYAKKAGLNHIEVQSNGRIYANKYYGKKLADAGVNNFVISFHSHKPEINDKIMGVPGAFKEQVQGIKNLNALGEKVKINIVLTKYNYKHLEEHVKFLIDNFEISEFRFTFVLIEGNVQKNPHKIVPYMKDVAPHICRAISIADKKVDCFIYNMVPCLLPGCEHYINDMGSYNTILIGPNFSTSLDRAKLNEKVKPDKCRFCKHNSWCNGVWKNYADFLGFRELKPQDDN